MQVRCTASAIVALAAAYAVVLQTTLLAIGGPLAASPAFAQDSLCATAKGASRQPMPADRANGCLAACLACCCTAVAPTAPAMIHYRSTLPRSMGVKIVAVAALPVSMTGAHRSRGPPPD
jgi:hypothetical protein